MADGQFLDLAKLLQEPLQALSKRCGTASVFVEHFVMLEQVICVVVNRQAVAVRAMTRGEAVILSIKIFQNIMYGRECGSDALTRILLAMLFMEGEASPLIHAGIPLRYFMKIWVHGQHQNILLSARITILAIAKRTVYGLLIVFNLGILDRIIGLPSMV